MTFKSLWVCDWCEKEEKPPALVYTSPGPHPSALPTGWFSLANCVGGEPASFCTPKCAVKFLTMLSQAVPQSTEGGVA